MIDFISTIRTDRLREISNYEEKGYTILDKNKYRLIDTIKVKDGNNIMLLGVEADNREVRFFITDKSSNIYLSLVDIYLILDCEDYKHYFLKMLQEQLELNKEYLNYKKNKEMESEFIYRSVSYKMRKMIECNNNINKDIILPDCDLVISNRFFFILIHVIQEKSNAFFNKGGIDSENLIYIDGILRWLIVLLSKKEDEEILNKIGWIYSEERKQFIYVKVDETEVSINRKYYLTEQEYKTIMK